MVLLQIRSIYGAHTVQIIVKIEANDTEIFDIRGHILLAIRSAYGLDTVRIPIFYGLYRGGGTRKFGYRGHILRVIGSAYCASYGRDTETIRFYRGLIRFV